MSTLEKPLITFGDTTYVIEDLPKEIQDMCAYYQQWSADHIKAMSEVNKCDAACRALTTEIGKRLQELQDKKS